MFILQIAKRPFSLATSRKSLGSQFLTLLKTLEAHKPVVVCGDFNAAHTPLDLARPKDNEKMPALPKKNDRELKTLSTLASSILFAIFFQVLSAILGGHIGPTVASVTSVGVLITSSSPLSSFLS